MKRLGRPKIHQKQNRVSISFSDEAWEILELVKGGKKSELISLLVKVYAPSFPQFFIRKEKK